jgi:NitT/TauT family transport system substrate-binding protein
MKIYAMMGVLALALGLLLQPSPISGQAGTEDEPIRVTIAPFLSYAPFFIAEAEGYFEEHDVVVEPVQVGGASETLTALIQGDMDVYAGVVDVRMLNAMVRGGNLRLVADRGYFKADGCPSSALLVRQETLDSGDLDDPEFWRNGRFEFNAANFNGFWVDSVLADIGVQSADLTLERLPAPARGEALANGATDMSGMSEPWVTINVQAGNGVIWEGGDNLEDFQYAIMMFGPSLLEDHPEAGERFMTAYLQGVRTYNEGKTERNLEILTEAVELGPELLLDMCWNHMRDDGALNVDSIIDFQDWALEQDLLDELVPVDEFYDSRFVDAANAALDTED